MKRRLGIFITVFMTLVFLKLISVGLGWINLPSDMAVAGGVSLIGAIAVLSPGLYIKVWKKMINLSTINTPKENTNHEV
jgi:hypothetical protein